MLRSIIPQLVSFDTDLNNIKGFYLSEDFGFYEDISSPHQFHYKIVITEDINISNEYDYRNGYHLKKGDLWSYQRKIKFVHFKFQYDIKNKIFYINKAYLKVPFEIGGITPVGRVIADIVNLELYINGYVLFRGCSVKTKGKTKCLIGMGYNGKTTYVSDVIAQGGKYISEDFILYNIDNYLLYPISPYYQKKNFARKANQKLSFQVTKDNTITKPVKTSNIFLIQNTTNKKYKPNTKTLYDYLLLCGLNFLNNAFTRSVMIEENLHGAVDKITNRIKEIKKEYKFINLRNYNFDKLDADE